MTDQDYSPVERYDHEVEERFRQILDLHPANELTEGTTEDDSEESKVQPEIVVSCERVLTAGQPEELEKRTEPFWTLSDKGLRINNEGEVEVIDRTRARYLAHFIVKKARAGKKTSAGEKSATSAREAIDKKLERARLDVMIIEPIEGWSLNRIRGALESNDKEQHQSPSMRILTEYYIAVAREVYGEGIAFDVPGAEKSFVEFLSSTESTKRATHEALAGFVKAAATNNKMRTEHYEQELGRALRRERATASATRRV